VTRLALLLELSMVLGAAGEPPVEPTGQAEAGSALDPLRQWGQWRGPLGTGEAPHADPPIAWSEDHNLRWKVPLPGAGHSTPIVWGERVYATTAVPAEALEHPIPDTSPGGHDNAPITHHQAWTVLALERASGALAWQTEVARGLPHQGAHVSASFASASPATDGERVYASFGSRGVYALDLQGQVLWRADLGRLDVKHGHGEGSSPALLGDTLVVNCDHEGPSFVAALDTATGAERWRAPRDEETSWSSPLAIEHEGVPQVIVSGTRRIRSYRLADGALLWECGGLSHNIVASPVAGGGLLFAGSSYETRSLLAIRLGGSGDLTGGERVAWSRTEGTPYVPSPLLYGDALYVVRHYQNVITRLEAHSGDEHPGAFRVAGLANIYASPLGAAGRVYLTDLEGTTAVLEDGEKPRVLATNRLEDSFAASPAASGNELFLRGARFLYCLADG
jgi:outer membrane protein assembly factor BamB